MLIVHTADLHLYANHKYSIDGSRLADIRRNLLMMLKYGLKRKQEGTEVILVIAGDIFHNYNPDEKLLKVFSGVLKTAIKNGIKVRMITGNHDTDGINYAFESVHNILGIDELMVKIFPLVPGKTVLYTEIIDGVNIIYVPWQKELIQALQDAKNKRIKKSVNVLVTHCAVDGAKTNSGYHISEKITKKMLEGYDYVALGDFHNNQCLGENIWYCGSPVKFVWDEKDDFKYFNTYDTTTGKVNRIKLPDIDFIEMNIQYSSIDKLIKNKLIEYDGKKLEGSFIRVVVKGSINFGEKIATLKKHLYNCGAKGVMEKIIADERAEPNYKGDYNLDLSINDACLKFLENSEHDDKINLKEYISKKLELI